MSKLIQFGELVPGYDILVLNEREIRAAAGILFLATYTSLMYILFNGNFILIKYVITLFLLDFLIRVFINPKFAPSLVLGRLIVRNQVPEYVGAQQKKFAWTIGIILSAIMFVFFVIVNAFSPITGLICLTCLAFLYFESVFGICLGCTFYPIFHKTKAQRCPGEVCDVKSKQEIQKTSAAQLLVLAAFFAFLFLAVFFFKERVTRKPYDLFGISRNAKTK
jgi:hypothetical protein